MNSATKEELMMLPSVGPKTAERIMEKRRSIGGFSSVSQLKGVKTVGKVRFERIERFVTVKKEYNIKSGAAK